MHSVVSVFLGPLHNSLVCIEFWHVFLSLYISATKYFKGFLCQPYALLHIFLLWFLKAGHGRDINAIIFGKSFRDRTVLLLVGKVCCRIFEIYTMHVVMFCSASPEYLDFLLNHIWPISTSFDGIIIFNKKSWVKIQFNKMFNNLFLKKINSKGYSKIHFFWKIQKSKFNFIQNVGICRNQFNKIFIQ